MKRNQTQDKNGIRDVWRKGADERLGETGRGEAEK